MVRSIEELTDVPDSAWPQITAAAGKIGAQVLPVAPEQGREVLYRLQVTARSALGALALHCGGLLIDHGWLRLLAGGAPGLPDLARANGLADPGAGRQRQPGAMFIGVDVLGGRFAIDGGGLRVAMGKVCYFAPDTLGWQSLGVDHNEFLAGMLRGAATDFYAPMRWSGWQQEVAELPVGAGLALDPPPFEADGATPATAARRTVSLGELFACYDAAAEELARRNTAGPGPDTPPD